MQRCFGHHTSKINKIFCKKKSVAAIGLELKNSEKGNALHC